MAIAKLLALVATLEAVTGLVFMIHPPTIVRLLLGSDLSGAGTVLGRVAGFGLLSLGIACWPGTGKAVDISRALKAMFSYNLLVTIYLACLRLGGEWTGMLLVPTLAVHAVFTLLLARAWWGNRQRERTKS